MGNLVSWKLGTTEIGKSCGYNNPSSRFFRVYVPKILPLIQFGTPTTKSVGLNRSCFCNSTSCKPSVSPNVISRNYLDIPLADNANISCTTNDDSLKIEIFNGNVDKMYVISRL